MSPSAALTLLAKLPDHVGGHVLSLLDTGRGVYEAQRIVAFHLGGDVADEVIATLVRQRLEIIEQNRQK